MVKIDEVKELVEKIGKTLELIGDVEDEEEFYTLPVYVSWVINDLREAYKLLQEMCE